MTARTLRTTYQFKIILLGISPKVWRRIQLASSATLEDLHHAIQVVMGWTDSHTHLFCGDEFDYGVPDPAYPNEIKDETGVRLERMFKQINDKMNYVYDLGDDWEHELRLEKILPYDPAIRLPVCIEGECACPPDDVGGLPGYENFLEAMEDPSHPEHTALSEWIGGMGWDAEHFDLVEANDLLRAYCD
jgi:hypothetical protein